MNAKIDTLNSAHNDNSECVRTKTVGIFGLSANPPTGYQGHLGVVNFLISLDKFDEIWIMPVYSHIYMSKKSLLSYEHRFHMCGLNFENDVNLNKKKERTLIKVSDLEKQLYDNVFSQKQSSDANKANVRLGTIDLIEHLHCKEVDNKSMKVDIHLVLGTDTFNDLVQGKWKQSEK